MCSECNTNPKLTDPKILDQNVGVRLTYDITLPPELYKIPFPEFTDYIDRELQKMKIAVYDRAKESYVERATAEVIHSIEKSE